MAMRRSRKKEPSKEKHQLKEKLPIPEGVLDENTLIRIGKLFSHGIVESMHFKIARGKEADVYLANAGKELKTEFLVVKIFRVETTSFMKRIDYIQGDPRFGKIKGSTYSMVCEWCKKEFGNLVLASGAGAHVPEPYFFNGNVLAMELIGEDGKPSNTLKSIGTEQPEKVLDSIIGDIKKLCSVELVHADLSEYNILMKGNVPYLIDFGQAVVFKHPSAMEFLRRDIRNVLGYFSKEYGIEKDPEEVFGDVVSYSGTV